VANTAFGGTFASLLNTALRVESGLTYGASCIVQQQAAGGSIGIASYTKTESTEKAIDLALETLRAFRAAGLGGARIARARNYINGQFPTELETAAQLAGRLATDAFYGFGGTRSPGIRRASPRSTACRSVASSSASIHPTPTSRSSWWGTPPRSGRWPGSTGRSPRFR